VHPLPGPHGRPLPRVICSDKDLLLLLWVTFKFGPYDELVLREYLVYKAGPGRPSLHLLPDPHPLVLRAWEVALVPHGDDDGHFLVAALCLTQAPWIYDLHLFSSITCRCLEHQGVVRGQTVYLQATR
jgi:hypothetical protein